MVVVRGCRRVLLRHVRVRRASAGDRNHDVTEVPNDPAHPIEGRIAAVGRADLDRFAGLREQGRSTTFSRHFREGSGPPSPGLVESANDYAEKKWRRLSHPFAFNPDW